MPKLINSDYTCELCDRQAEYISFNSKKYRCVEKITQCPGFIKKASLSRRNRDPEIIKHHMKNMSKKGNNKLKILHQNIEWRAKKGKNISMKVKGRGGHTGQNNPMYGNKHTVTTKQLQSLKAQDRNYQSYTKATKTKIYRGLATPKELKSEWTLYREQVRNITRINWIKHQNEINPNNLKRGNQYELDHKVSILEGFLNNILPNIIGHWANLEIVPFQQNRSKHFRSSITLTQLFQLVDNTQ